MEWFNKDDSKPTAPSSYVFIEDMNEKVPLFQHKLDVQ